MISGESEYGAETEVLVDSDLEAIMPGIVDGWKSEINTMLKALEMSEGNQSKASRLLGVTPQAVHKFLHSQ